MRAAGCGFFSSSSGTCRALSRSAQRMERNLSSLQGTHSRLRGGGSGRSRAQLLAALDANDCRGRKSIIVASREPGLLQRLFGEPDNRRRSFLFDLDDDAREPRDHESGQSWRLGPGFDPGKYRTFCVRTCDGYYFPMSPSSSSNELGRDAQNCQTACPGADMQLYYHHGSGEEAGTMMSMASGSAYGDLPTAFAYRSDRPADAACGCAIKAGGFTIIAGDGRSAEPQRRARLLPLPTSRPDPATDPETLANIDGDFGAAAIQKLLSKRSDPALVERKVRVVGPVFLPDPAAATGRPVPDQTEVQ